MSDIQPFEFTASEEELEDLRRRLRATRWPDPEPVTDWSQGISLAYVQECCDYWINGYDWRARESILRRFPQFTTPISVEGCAPLSIHFLHVRSPHEDATPLLLTHGWPGSFVEFLDVIGPLSDPTSYGGDASDAFHIVCPSLPGYGFSGKPTEPGWGLERIVAAWGQLMARLGYERFGAQGGDWGAMVTTLIGARNAEHCLGIHLNMPVVIPSTLEDLTESEQRWIDSVAEFQRSGSAYAQVQGTRPQTLGFGLADSPAGQCAWILEKFHAWTDNRGAPEDAVDRDRLLDNVMIYWLTNSAASSARLYWESYRSPPFEVPQVPVGCSVFPEEIMRPSRRWAEAHFGQRLVWFNELDRGGHFAAMEEPDLFVDEVRQAFRLMR
jgi:pimeloyl-ACP methyl ester carboxylesterase